MSELGALALRSTKEFVLINEIVTGFFADCSYVIRLFVTT
jgi:hypothetical protein